MRAVYFNEYGPPEVLQLREMEIPSPKADEMLVRIAAAAVNPKDCMVRKGKFRFITGNHFPQLLGYDLAGEVVKVPDGAHGFNEGDAVYAMINDWKAGAYAEYAVVKLNEAARQPANLNSTEAAAIPLAAQTALQALRDHGRVAPGMRVCINGATGGVGTFAVQIAKILGTEVTAVCSHRVLELPTALGAAEVIDYTRDNILELGKRFNVFFDVFGNRSFAEAAPCLHEHGVYITTVPNQENLRLHGTVDPATGKQARLVAVYSRTQDLQQLAQWCEAGQLRAVIDRTYPLTQAPEAHTYIETKRAKGKVVLIP